MAKLFKQLNKQMSAADIFLSVFWSLILIVSGVCGKIEKGAVNQYTSEQTTNDVCKMKTDIDTLKWKVASIEKDTQAIPELRTAVNELNVNVSELKGVLVGAKIIQITK